MLSLKNNKASFTKASKKIIDLPEEILDLILEYVFAACGSKIAGILPISLTCQRLRLSAVPVLFKSVIVLADSGGLRVKSLNALRQLADSPHLLGHVRQLQLLTPLNEDVRRPSDPVLHYESSKELLSLAALRMTGLRRIRLDHLSNLTIDLLRSLADTPDLHMTLDLLRMKNDLCDSSSAAKCKEIAAQCLWSFDVSFPPFNRDFTRTALMELVLGNRNIITFNSYRTSHLIQYFVASGDTFSQLQELYLSAMTSESLSSLLSSGHIYWKRLRKLQVEGDLLVETVFSFGFEHMPNLTHLRLSPQHTAAFHAGCSGNTATNIKPDKLSFTHLRNLKQLELLSVCNHFSMEQITTPTLRSLRIQLPEDSARPVNLQRARSPADIRWLARNVPDLEVLELHVGDLENLWHPTAIPGVDVDVEVYQFLQALSEIPNLKQLRLFPRYSPGTLDRNDYASAGQPLSDEQAVRIFRHLKAQRPTLEMLSIAATYQFPWTVGPMSWTVRTTGKTSVLVTRQAGKNYEIEQDWGGERRIGMCNKRHTYQQPYLPDLGDWTYRLSLQPDRPPV